MGQLAQRAQAQTMAVADPSGGIKQILQSNWDKIQPLMSKHMTAERMFQLSVSAINHTPELLEASPETLVACVMKCAALGLEPSAVDGLGRAYILPFRNKGKVEATFVLGYRGMIQLARNSGKLASIEARAVHEGDVFEFEYGLDEKLRHIPKHGSGRPLTHVYCVAKFKDGGHYVDVMTKDEVDAIRARSKTSKFGPWVTDYEAMARKTVIRRAFPYLPVSVEAQEAVAADEQTPDYSAVFHPVIEEQPAQDGPTDEEKAELRRLTDECVALGYDANEMAHYLFGQYKEGGIEAARSAAAQSVAAVGNVDPETGEVTE